MNYNELREKSLYKVRDEIAGEDICPVKLPCNAHYVMTIYADASFAVGDLKQSVSGYVRCVFEWYPIVVGESEADDCRGLILFRGICGCKRGL